MVFSSLLIKDLSVPIKLGVSAKERENLQEILVGVEVRFVEPPSAVKSDQIDNTICYYEICNRIKKYCQNREFNLIEKIAGDLYQLVREISGISNQVIVRVHKVSPPIEGLKGGALFTFGDFESGSLK